MNRYECKFCHKLLFIYMYREELHGRQKAIIEVFDKENAKHLGKKSCQINIKCSKCKKINKIDLRCK